MLIEACKLIDQMEISQQNQDTSTCSVIWASRGERQVEGLFEVCWRRRSMLPPPPASRSTSPKCDDSNSESFCKRFIVVFGGGRRGAGAVARVESLRGRMPPSGMVSEGERQAPWWLPEGRVETSRGCLGVCWRRVLGKAPSVRWTSPPNATIVLSNLGENLALRFFMNLENVSKTLISRATVPSPNATREEQRVAFGEG